MSTTHFFPCSEGNLKEFRGVAVSLLRLVGAGSSADVADRYSGKGGFSPSGSATWKTFSVLPIKV
jgi:hypothetical protein